jgi:CRISPR-associated protein Csm1
MSNYDELKAGALLHDIGKWYKLVNGDKCSKHTDFGVRFVEDYKKIHKLNGLDDNRFIKSITSLIEKHHNENDNNNLLNILKISDILSNGELIYYDEDTSKEQYINLVSIFENISLPKENNREKKENNKKTKYDEYSKYNIVPLNVSEELSFPVKNNELIRNMDKNNIENDIKKINNFENLYQFIQKYTWCIPSTYIRAGDTNYFPDVSLFDHLKTTCAIACSLYKNLNNEEVKKLLNELNLLNNEINKIKDELKNNGENIRDENKHKIKEKANDIVNNMSIIKNNTFSLIHGDISGVQDFIFNITSKGANKSLKGRSFYLDFLTELCAKYVIQKLDLPMANILFYGGGHFYILSYNIDNNITEKFEEEINNILFEKFGADLYVAIGKVDLKPIDFLIDCMEEDAKIGMPYKWKESAEATSKRKMRKFKYVGTALFEPKGSGNETKRCPVCKEENEMKNTNNEKCIYCSSFEDLTVELGNFEKIDNTIKIENLKNLKILNGFFENENKSLNIKFENKEYNLPDKDGNLTIPYKIWSIAFPLDNDNIMEFSKLAELSKGVKKLAILKMDVDNLGKIITKGLGDNATISRLSTLSSMLTLYFTGYIPYLIRKEYSQKVYLTYSGGDDTLIVGAWDKVWDLAKKINDDFKRFVCNNPDITLSAGVVLVNPKFEYRKGVYLAEDELDNAKENKININGENKEKNSVSIFGHALRWDKIGDERKFEKNLIEAMDNTGKKRIVHLTQKVYTNLEKAFKKNDNGKDIRLNIPYLWRMKYYLHRNYGSNGWEHVKFIEGYIDNIDLSKKNIDFNDILIASRIAELKSRVEGKNNELDE